VQPALPAVAVTPTGMSNLSSRKMSMLNAALAEGRYVTDELKMFHDTARRFMQAEVAPHVLRWDEQGHVDRELWNKACCVRAFRPSTAAAAATSPTRRC
jgi:alkylation response protein AidB-like acyl-CoA dehydrogenase